MTSLRKNILTYLSTIHKYYSTSNTSSYVCTRRHVGNSRKRHDIYRAKNGEKWQMSPNVGPTFSDISPTCCPTRQCCIKIANTDIRQTQLRPEGRTFETSAFPTPLFALPKLPVFFCKDLASSIHAWEHSSPNDPDTTCKGIPLSRGQMPSQHNTLPHTNDVPPPTCCRYFQTWQLDCHVQILEH
jgi:hypothetical protein